MAGEEPVPLFEELLETFPEVRWNIDVKAEPALLPLLELIERTNTWDRVCVGSFSEARGGPRPAPGRSATGHLVRHPGRPQPAAALLGRAGRAAPLGGGRAGARGPVGIQVVDHRFVHAAHARGLQVHVWTVNDPDRMHRLLDLGVDGIMTDHIDTLRKVAEDRVRLGLRRSGTVRGPRPNPRDVARSRGSEGTVGTDTLRTDAADEAADRRREQHGWYFYDWACSGLLDERAHRVPGPSFDVGRRVGGRRGRATSIRSAYPCGPGPFFAYSVSLSVIVAVLVIAPGGRRRRPLGPQEAVAGRRRVHRGRGNYLHVLPRRRPLSAGADCSLVVANAAQSVAMMLCNSYLPQIAPPEERDAVSSRGWAFGYAAGALVLVANLTSTRPTTPLG